MASTPVFMEACRKPAIFVNIQYPWLIAFCGYLRRTGIIRLIQAEVIRYSIKDSFTLIQPILI
jgi:hypothetical protein